MANLKLKNIFKIYSSFDKKNSSYQAVTNFNLDIKDGEFVVFVGPSGCGKSTTLRMIAGLEEITRGDLYIGDRLVNDIPAKDRNIAMVFQNYALYPHMSAYENIAFGLRNKLNEVPVLDKDGNEIKVVDKKAIKQLKYEIKLIKDTYYLDEKIQELLKEEKEIESKLGTGKKDPEYKANAEKAKSIKGEIKKLIAEYKKNGNAVCDEAIKEKEAQINTLTATPSIAKTKKVHLPKEEINSKTMAAAEVLGITELLKRKPREMSGGQRQRVALGRALVRNPEVFLLDEPLSNLDAKLRVSMRSEITRLHQELKTTFIYVTHDQIEAMTMGDRIVVMDKGVIQQVDTPTNLFDFPNNIFVAGFIGTPQMNFFHVKMKKEARHVEFVFEDGEKMQFSLQSMRKIADSYLDGNTHDVVLGVRGENILSSKEGIHLKVLDVENLGNETQLTLEGDKDASSSYKNINIKVPYRVSSKVGDEVSISLQPEGIHLFDKETTLSIMEAKSVIKDGKEENKF
ncbi:MAG: ABC transporter ATP-binding protein [Bacilli bacterium]|nr:ABC transporter ATP-binding protein [Bacilli bacterium]